MTAKTIKSISASLKFVAMLPSRLSKISLVLFACISGPLMGFSQPTNLASSPAVASARVISLYNSSGTYFDLPGVNFYEEWWPGQWTGHGDYTITNTSAKVKGYQTLLFVGVGFEATPINVSGADTLHVDVWTPNGTGLGVRVVQTGGGQQADVIEPLIAGTWNSLNIPLSYFTATNGALNLSSIQQLGWILNEPSGTTAPSDLYIDNVYFYNSTTAIPPQAAITNNVIVKAGTMINPYLYDNDFAAPANGGGMPSLVASYSGPVLTFSPSTYGSIVGDAYTADLYDANPSLVGNPYFPSQIVFTGHCNANTLAAGYSAVAWIKDFAGDYSSSTAATVPLTNGQDFSVTLTTSDPSHHIQWGIEMTGTAVADNSGLGNVQIYAQPAAQHVALTATNTWYGEAFGNGGFWYSDPVWGPGASGFAVTNDVPAGSGIKSVGITPWYNQPGTLMDSYYYVEDNTLLGGEVIFSGYCWTNTITNAITATAFIKEFDASWNVVGSTNVALVAGQPFTADYICTGTGVHLQYGLEAKGTIGDPSPAPGSLGAVVVGSSLAPVSYGFDGQVTDNYVTGWTGTPGNPFGTWQNGFIASDAQMPLMATNGFLTFAPNNVLSNTPATP